MYIVRRPFKNLGKTLTVGSVITEPTSVKRFKGKLAEGKIIYVSESEYANTHAYFKEKFGVDVPQLKPVKTKTVEVKPAEAKPAEAKPAEAKKVAVKAAHTETK